MGLDRSAELPREPHRIPPPGPDRRDNSLLATKVLVPVDGKVRENVGLLGSPSFEIPRTVDRDTRVNHPKGEAERLRRLRAKNRHNLQTIGLALLVRWGYLFGVGMLAFGAGGLYRRWGWLVLASGDASRVLFTTAYFVLVERAVAGFRPLRPRTCSIYEPYFWWHDAIGSSSSRDALDRVFSGDAVQERPVEAAGRPVGQAGLRRRLLSAGAHPRHHRR